MTDDGALLSRRALLAAGVGGLALAAGCTSHAARPIADPDASAIEAARQAEQMLVASYADGTAGHALHLAHLHALGGALPSASPGQSPSVSPSPVGVGSESSTVAPLMVAARNARRGSTAALLASLAASHAVFGGMKPGSVP